MVSQFNQAILISAVQQAERQPNAIHPEITAMAVALPSGILLAGLMLLSGRSAIRLLFPDHIPEKRKN